MATSITSPPLLSHLKFQRLTVVVLLLFLATAASSTTETVLEAHQKAVESACESTPHRDLCVDTLKLSVSVNVNPSTLAFTLYSLQTAISEVTKLSSAFSNSGSIVEGQKSSIQDCKDLHDVTLSSLQKSFSVFSKAENAGRKIRDVNAYLSAALTNKNTCLEGLSKATGPYKSAFVQSLTDTYKHVANSLAIVSKWEAPPKPHQQLPKSKHNRRLMSEFPSWLSSRDRKILEIDIGGGEDEDGKDQSLTVTVAKDGSGNFTSVSDAVRFVPSNSLTRTFIVIKAGVYEEYVEIPMEKMNVVLIGDGSDTTVIRGRRSTADGWTSFRSATFAVSGQGFLARDLTFENYAGAAKGQAVALRINADLAALYRCTVAGYQDTLYVHSFRQFFRECNIYGTVDFIFGNAAAIFQNSNLIARIPIHGQSNVITAQGRDDPNEQTGISIQGCSIIASKELAANPGSAKTYLGRPWQVYSRTVYIDSFLDELVDPAGWTNWIGDIGLNTLYYGEYQNTGPGSAIDNRVDWEGYHVMNYDDAVDFTVSAFLDADEWLDSTSFPYDDDV